MKSEPLGFNKLADGSVVSTVAYPLALLGDPRWLYETLVTDQNGTEVELRRYKTKEEAVAGHVQAVAAWAAILG